MKFEIALVTYSATAGNPYLTTQSFNFYLFCSKLQSFFAERFFHIFDKEKSEHISLRELKEGISVLASGSKTEKLRFLFQVYDIDGE